MSVFEDIARRQQTQALAQSSAGLRLTPRQQGLLGQLARESGQTLETIGMALDTPGAIARGILAGDPASGFAWDRDRRVTGEELLDQYNLKVENPYISGAVGFGAEVLTDPLAYLSGPLTAYSKAGLAARGAGLLQDAPRVASKILSEPSVTRSFSERALRRAGVQRTAQGGFADAALATRPIYGPRLAQQKLSLNDLVMNSADQAAARTKVDTWLKANYPNLTYADVANQKLGGTFGIGMPFGSSTDAINPFGEKAGAAIADVLDLTGQRIAWSPVGRGASALFQKAVGGEYTAGGQMQALRRTQQLDLADKEAREIATPMIQKLGAIQIPQSVASQTGVQSIMSAEGNSALTRIIEGVPTQNDTMLLSQSPGLQQWVNEWHALANNLQIRGRSMGLSVHDLKDPNGLNYLPRFGDEFTPDNLDRVVPSGRVYGAKTSDMMARVDSLKLKGGLDTIRFVSKDPVVRQYAESRAANLATRATDESVGQRIAQIIQQRTGEVIPPEKAARVARIMQDMNVDIPANTGVFSSHPATSIQRYIEQRFKAFGNTEAGIESLADAAVNKEYTTIRGGQHYTLAEAMQRYASSGGLEPGIKGVSNELDTQLRYKIAQRMGIQPDQVNLSLMSVPKTVVNRITKLNDFYSSPEAQGAVLQLMNGLTTIFKGFVLAFPSRYSRDMYSGGFQNWLENGSIRGTLSGMGAASHVVAGDYDKAKQVLMAIPKYQGMAWPDVLREFINDVGSSGTLKGLSNLDFSSSNVTGQTFSQLVPGMAPSTWGGAFAELAPKKGRTYTQFVKDFATVRGVNTTYETMNPLLRWGEKMNEKTDTINRLGGFIALLTQGVDIDQAAKRVLASQVDYSSLTPFEQNTMKFIFPWWSYNSRMGKFVVEHLMNRPGGRFGQTIRSVNDIQATTDDTYIPQSLRQRFAIRDPFESFFPPSGGAKRYFVDTDVPGVDILNTLRLSSQSGLGNWLSDTVSQTMGELANQAAPPFRAAAELATGQDLFTKRPLEESYTNADRIYQAVTGRQDKLTPLAKVAISNTPGIQRLLGVGGALSDQRLTFGERLAKLGINSTLGVKVATVTPEFEELEATRKIDAKVAPWVRTFEISHVPEELEPYVDPSALELIELKDVIRKNLQQRWKADRSGASKVQTGVASNPLLTLINK